MKKVFALFLVLGSLARAETVVVGQLIDDPGTSFTSFGDQFARGATRGANFFGTDVSWYGINMSSVSGVNGISWTGSTASGTQYNYSDTSAGLGTAANSLANSGIWSPSAGIQISANAGTTYSIDLLFANQFSGTGAGYYPYRVFDVKVGGLLYVDDLTLNGTQSNDRRPLVYRFEVTPSTNQINITFAAGAVISGSQTDTNPYVNAVSVTQVPEPSSGALLVAGMVGWAVIRRRK